MARKKNITTGKPSAAKRTLNSGANAGKQGAPFQQQDPKRRLGDFVGTGEHARVGGRAKGIVGQRVGKSRTDKRSK